MKKFLVALQYWDGDRKDALELLELFSETVEPNNPWADLLVFYRFDATPPDEELLKKLCRNFNKVIVQKGGVHEVGYPQGCNGLWHSLVMFCEERFYLWKDFQEYKAVLCIEGDVSPINQDWLRMLSEEWDQKQPCMVLGDWSPLNQDHPKLGHINGNMMFRTDMARASSQCFLSPGTKAWDTYLAPIFKQLGWEISKRIVNWFKYPTCTEEEFLHLKNAGYAILHGVKDSSAKNIFLNYANL